MDLYLIRHGETQANADGIVQGWMDTELNDKGIKQATQAADSFDKDIDAIFSSNLKRATKTADPFRKKFPDLPYFEDDRLRERGFGDATGYKRDGFNWEEFWASDDEISIHNAETLELFNSRVQSFIDSLPEKGFKRILIVTHSGTINRFQDLTSDNYAFTSHPNGSIVHLRL